jgi:hypothetical protein
MDFGAAKLTERGAAAAIGEGPFRTSGVYRPAAGNMHYPVELIDIVRFGEGHKTPCRQSETWGYDRVKYIGATIFEAIPGSRSAGHN